MKKMVVSVLAVVLAAFLSSAADQERVSMVVDSSKAVTLPFVIESFRVIPANAGIHVEAVESRLRIMPSVVGEFTIVAEGGGISKEVALSVKSNLTKVLKKLRTDLDALAELDIGINEDRIAVRGTVRNPEHWRYLKSVLPHYGEDVVNYAVFQPSASTFKGLRAMLENAGVKFAEEGAKPKTGELAVSITADAVLISGTFYSKEQIEKVKQAVATQAWLSTDGGEGAVRCILDLTVVETVITVDVVYAAVSGKDLSAIGSEDVPVLTTVMSYMYDVVQGRQSKALSIKADANQAVTFLAQNGLTRTYNAGHVSFNNNDEKGGELHTGGSIKAKVQGIESGSIQDINYGLTLKVKGGLVGENSVKLDLDLTNSSLQDSGGDDYVLDEDSTKQTLTCGLGSTLVLAGSRKLSDSLSNMGFPYVRHIPVLKWFFGQDRDGDDDMRLLILVCPRIERDEDIPQIEIPVSESTRFAYDNARELNEKEGTEIGGKKHTGWMSWLNWFSF